MGMRIGGLATGMDIDGIVADLMAAERIPLDKMEQDKTLLEWERDAYREVNALYAELNLLLDDVMKRPSTYNSKTAISSQPDAISATASSGVEPGSYSIQVTQLARNAINASQQGISGGTKIDASDDLASQLGNLNGDISELPETISFKTYHNGEETHEITIDEGDSLNDILKKITDQNNGVRAFYDANSDKVVMETIKTGDHNQGGYEIEFDFDGNESSNFFTEVLGLTQDGETGGTNAEYSYNGVTGFSSTTNSATLNGINYNFTNVMDSPAYITVDNDVDKSVESITKFVEKYNELVEFVNGKTTEKRNRDYPPLTTEQRREMSESEIEQWEEQAKSGMLRSSSILTTSLSRMRSSLNSVVETDGAFNHLSQIGITTTSNYMDGGKLEIDEDKLRDALRTDSRAVQSLFTNNSDDGSRGIAQRLDDAVDRTAKQINERAGRSTSNLEQYSLGRRLKEMDTRMVDFQRRLQQTEDRYWRQFTAMERAIQQMNDQSNYMFQQFNQM
ncbi:flagellar hook-associated protein 2 [Amphibacillus jilinensis]|uniref:flagellar hook-associated protein 2 n=1 Tax=Amphibacillus jilinensis TaxID=1216008 RepID=UPI0002E53C8F|nr:flagellar hook-associated protein 2 [Amphibacillus jilinensis]